MSKKVLFVGNLLNKHIEQFHLPYLEWFQKNGYTTFVFASNDSNHAIPNEINYFVNFNFSRSLFSFSNFKAFIALIKILNKENFDIIHTHTPIPSALIRLSRLFFKKHIKSKIFYTAHGFHFFHGSSFFSWITYFPIEYFLAKLTYKIITINSEDYELAKKYFNTKVYYSNGLGVSFENIYQIESSDKYSNQINNLKSLNIKILISIGELNKNKNHSLVLKVLKDLPNRNFHYFIIGSGKQKDNLIKIIKKFNLLDRVTLTGQLDKNTLYYILKNGDFYIHPSFREGLSFSVMEAIYFNLPVFASNIRGVKDIIPLTNHNMLFNPRKLSNLKNLMVKYLGYEKNRFQFVTSTNFNNLFNFYFSKIEEKLIDLYEFK